MFMGEKIPEIFMKEFKEEIVEIIEVSKGVDQTVKIVRTRNSVYVMKVPNKHLEIIQRECIACEKLRGLVLVPEIVARTNQYIIEKFIVGEDLDEVLLKENTRKKIYKELGQLLRKIHSVPMKGYGFIGMDGNGEYFTLKERVYCNRKEDLNYFDEEKLLTQDEMKRLKNYLDRTDFYADSKESVLLHFDFEDWNIRINKDEVVGILDFGDLSAGPKAYDLARPFISHYLDGMFEYFIEGYGKIDMNEVKYYAVVSLLWIIPYHCGKGDKKNVEKGLKILREIVLN